MLWCQLLFLGISPWIQIVAVRLLAGPLQEHCQACSFVRWDLHTPTITGIVYTLWWRLCTYLVLVALSTPFVFTLWRWHLPELTLHFELPGQPLQVSQWVEGDSPSCLSCRSSQLLGLHPPEHRLMKLCFTSIIPWNLSLLHQNLSVEGLLGAHFALRLSLLFLSSPSASFPESSPLPTPPVCHPSLLMRGRDQQGRPLEFDRATCCASTFLPP